MVRTGGPTMTLAPIFRKQWAVHARKTLGTILRPNYLSASAQFVQHVCTRYAAENPRHLS